MKHKSDVKLSVIVPIYNEAAGLPVFHEQLMQQLKSLQDISFELIYCDDGSSDTTAELVHGFHQANKSVKLLRLSRNFGKENALSAGISYAQGDGVLMLDGDGQHPIERIPEFISAWRDGAQVVAGVRQSNTHEGVIKQYGSKLFYWLVNKLTARKLTPGLTDYCLIDRTVQRAFLTLPETDRLTRGLIDWLGFKRTIVYFDAHARGSGRPSYGNRKLFKLATDSLVSLTPMPLYIFGVFGVLITSASFIFGVAVLVEQELLNDPWHWRFTGTAMLGIMTIFLVGIVLMSQGMLSLYLSHVHNQSKRRPAFIVDDDYSVGLSLND